MNETAVISGILFVFGAAIGSFLNVCIVRLPREKSIVKPRSHCVHCQRTIGWFDNIPLVSFVILGGRCRYCRQRISWRYPLVELITAVAFVGMYRHYGLGAPLFAYLLMITAFIVATFVDLEHRIIPDEVSVGGMVLGIILSFFIPALHLRHAPAMEGMWPHVLSLGYSLLGVLVGGGTIYLMGVMGDFIFRKESMGGGDIKLLAMIGAFMGWKLALLTFFIAPFFGAVYGIAEKIRTKESAIAYGPFLVLGALISLFWGQDIIRWVLQGYGIYNIY